ncbi:glutaredoxin domain-containing protein [uncultured Ilyobacter sp.]|uniref:glutaredoxin family protein n=1 Tax=uncultured Ilyobacter sp. TaxID=544433 RepID=UPI0029F5BB43|nr:glutaredoxin domain-containing protein [uncultured Ilyobacter sp.]
MIKVYGKTGCSRCQELKGILEGKGKEFQYIEDMNELRRVAIKAKIMMAPIVEYDGGFYTMEEFLKKSGL